MPLAQPSQRTLWGTTPTTLTAADAYAAYREWKSSKVEYCAGGRARVTFTTSAETVSEGIGYGMLLAAAWRDQDLFNQLWNYYAATLNGNGLMAWRVGGCGLNKLDQGAASDADLDVAMSLTIAECNWPGEGYSNLAGGVFNAIISHLVVRDGDRYLLQAGDMWGGTVCGNPSYYAPGYYRAFAQFNAANATIWTQLANDTYRYLASAQNASTGLVGEWQRPTSLNCNKSELDQFKYNAARTPWRIATDYVWWGIGEAEAYAQKVTNWANTAPGNNGTGITAMGDGYYTDGRLLSNNHKSVFVGSFAAASMANPSLTDSFNEAFLTVRSRGSGDYDYYSVSLRALYMLLPTRMFAPECQPPPG